MEYGKRYFWHTQWIFKWLILPKEVHVKEWEMSLEAGVNSTIVKRFTGVFFKVPLHRWVWIRFLDILLNSEREYLRVFAANKYKKIRVKYEYPAGLIGTSVYSILPN